MNTSTKLAVSTSITRALALGALGMLATGAYASAPILSASPVVTNSSNLGGTTTTTGPTITTSTYVDNYKYNYSTSTKTDFTTEIDTAPTTTTAGLANHFSTVTTKNTWDTHTSKYDNLSIYVDSSGTNQAGDKWISLTGTVQSTINTTLSFTLSAQGGFTATATPFGPAAPLLASFYFGESAPTALSASTSTSLESLSYYTYSSSYSTASFNLLAGVAQNFVAYVYAPTDVSISDFNLYAYTHPNYDLVITPHSQVQVGPKTWVSSSILAPIPEPETYAMMLVGLGLVGFMARRRKQIEA